MIKRRSLVCALAALLFFGAHLRIANAAPTITATQDDDATVVLLTNPTLADRQRAGYRRSSSRAQFWRALIFLNPIPGAP